MNRIRALILLLAALLLGVPVAHATVCTLQVGTTGTISGLQNNQQINVIAGNLATFIEGPSAPTTTSTCLSSTAGVVWHDTTNNLLKVRDQADTTWITLGTFDETNKQWVSYVGGGT